ncbi:uncharacterized protein ACB058_019832 isoform 2-T2 [Synchiropus picturatus]
MDGVAAASAEDGGAEPITGAAEPAARTVEPLTETQVPPSTSGLCAEDASELEEMFCCDDCGEVFSEEAVFKEHTRHHQENRAGPDELDTSTVTENQGEPTNFCSVCSLSFAEASEFRSHMEQSHGPPPEAPAISPVKNFQCPDCGKSYHKYGFLLNHMRLHDQAPKSMIYDLEHLKTKSFNCETCGRSYSRASALDAHRRCHETNLFKSKPKVSRGKTQNLDSTAEEKPDVDLKHKKAKEANTDNDTTFECTCGKSFSSQMGLKTHQRFSQNAQCSPEEKPIKTSPESTLYCADCKKFYKTKVAFLNHQRWHEKSADPTKRFTCEECGKTFVLLENYFRHQRRHDIPEKSFQHQVCQLQKKQLECSHCGLKFSRASAFQSHQLQHTVDVDPEPLSTTPAALLSVVRAFQFEDPVKSQEEKCFTSSSAVEADAVMVESDDDLQSYDPADLNVEVISASDSEDDAAQDLNPDLELQCESDQEGKEGCEAHALASKQGMDLNIVQVDFELAKERCSDGAGAESEPSAGRYECPDCHRCFARQVSLRVHRTWHRMYKKRGQTQVMPLRCDECGLIFSCPRHYLKHLQQHQYGLIGQTRSSAGNLPSRWKQDEGGADHPGPTKPFKGYTCAECGKVYTYQVSYEKHLQEHGMDGCNSKPLPTLPQYSCPYCQLVFVRMSKLQAHMRSHSSRDPRCDQCDKTFATTKSYLSHVELHQQNPLWCLCCCKGFKDEASMHQHLQRHQLGKHKCYLCSKQFMSEVLLKRHYKSSHPTYTPAPSSHGDHPGSPCAQHENRATAPGETPLEGTSDLKCDSGELQDYFEFEESECGEPTHHQAPGEPVQVPDTKRQHGYWEWECVECDVGFDDVSVLHHHYMQHAAGEIPMLTDAI